MSNKSYFELCDNVEKFVSSLDGFFEAIAVGIYGVAAVTIILGICLAIFVPEFIPSVKANYAAMNH